MICALCGHWVARGEAVPFGIFHAHLGCAQDWAHEELWEDAQRGVEQ